MQVPVIKQHASACNNETQFVFQVLTNKMNVVQMGSPIMHCRCAPVSGVRKHDRLMRGHYFCHSTGNPLSPDC